MSSESSGRGGRDQRSQQKKQERDEGAPWAIQPSRDVSVAALVAAAEGPEHEGARQDEAALQHTALQGGQARDRGARHELGLTSLLLLTAHQQHQSAPPALEHAHASTAQVCATSCHSTQQSGHRTAVITTLRVRITPPPRHSPRPPTPDLFAATPTQAQPRCLPPPPVL